MTQVAITLESEQREVFCIETQFIYNAVLISELIISDSDYIYTHN